MTGANMVRSNQYIGDWSVVDHAAKKQSALGIDRRIEVKKRARDRKFGKKRMAQKN